MEGLHKSKIYTVFALSNIYLNKTKSIRHSFGLWLDFVKAITSETWSTVNTFKESQENNGWTGTHIVLFITKLY